ncbi:hypothetical protein LZ24_00909 [Desulfobotulus alkaliphilus]|uniref:Phasin protein n=1 Tax=Desulfobotulus alkaliphilus TaxID=622671 RepID=A0A562S0W4_9BACT|nr:hypothetical protein [Desulfobotulus alkaliphilus]TWI74306.1 hypothetical protein LZ24_00909 [Desulfobotulus alkaliphilus]
MEPKIIAKQILDFQKTLLNNFYTTHAAVQDQGEKITRQILDPLPQVPQQTKDLVHNWITTVRQGQEKVKKFQDESLNRMERFIQETPQN